VLLLLQVTGKAMAWFLSVTAVLLINAVLPADTGVGVVTDSIINGQNIPFSNSFQLGITAYMQLSAVSQDLRGYLKVENESTQLRY
jgi:hypothetical protein